MNKCFTCDEAIEDGQEFCRACVHEGVADAFLKGAAASLGIVGMAHAIRENIRVAKLMQELRDGQLSDPKDYYPEVARLTRRNREMHDRAQRAETRVLHLERQMNRLLGWTMSSGACADCEPFRAAPSCIDFLHEYDCSHLEEINKALALLGREQLMGHAYEDPKAEMRRLAEERTRRVHEERRRNCYPAQTPALDTVRTQRLEALRKRLETADETDPTMFSEFVSETAEVLPIEDQTLARRFGMTVGIAARWRCGMAAPHPVIRPRVYKFLLEQVDAELARLNEIGSR